MMTWAKLGGLVILLGGLLAADPLTLNVGKRIEAIDETFASALVKADNVKHIALQRANGERIKALRTLLTQVSKAGDADDQIVIKTKIAAAEKEGTKRVKPKTLVAHGGHFYALIPEKVSWYLAKSRCEEMGGHLATIDSEDESQFIRAQCAGTVESVWLGAFNEEGRWMSVAGTPIESTDGWIINDPPTHSVGLSYWHDSGGIDDYSMGGRLIFLCEWE